MASPLFIVGDLNMDLVCSKGADLQDFMNMNNLSNYVKDFTRIAFVTRYNSVTKKFTISKSLIDVIIHNSNLF